MKSAGIRELRDSLSYYVRQAEAGQRVAVTAHGRVVAELVPPASGGEERGSSHYAALIASGLIEPALEPHASLPSWPDIRVPPGTVAELIDADRGEP